MLHLEILFGEFLEWENFLDLERLVRPILCYRQ
jgi:hypothetical protein